MELKDRLIKAMELRGVSAADLHRLSGVPEPRISEVLSGKTKSPRLLTVSKFAVALDVSVSWLMSEEDHMDAHKPKNETGRQLSAMAVALKALIKELEALPESDQYRALADMKDIVAKYKK